MGAKKGKKFIPHGGNKFAPTWGAAHKAIDEHVAEVRGQMLVTLFGYMRDRWKFGRKRLEGFAVDFCAYLTDMESYGVAPIDIKETLKKEVGLDLEGLFSRIMEDTKKQKQDTKSAIHANRAESERLLRD